MWKGFWLKLLCFSGLGNKITNRNWAFNSLMKSFFVRKNCSSRIHQNLKRCPMKVSVPCLWCFHFPLFRIILCSLHRHCYLHLNCSHLFDQHVWFPNPVVLESSTASKFSARPASTVQFSIFVPCCLRCLKIRNMLCDRSLIFVKKKHFSISSICANCQKVTFHCNFWCDWGFSFQLFRKNRFFKSDGQLTTFLSLSSVSAQSLSCHSVALNRN